MKAPLVLTLLLCSLATIHLQAVKSSPCCPVQTSSVDIPSLSTIPYNMSISPQGTCLAVTNWDFRKFNSQNGSVSIIKIDRQNNTLGSDFQTIQVPGAFSVAFCPKNRCLVVGSFLGKFSVFRFNTCACSVDPTPIQTFEFPQIITTTDLKFSPDGKLLAALRGDGQIALFKMNDRCFLSEPTLYPVAGQQSTALEFSPDGSLLAVISTFNGASKDNVTVYRVNACSGTLTENPHIFSTQTNDPTTIQFSPCGNCLAIGHSNNKGTLTIFAVNKKTGVVSTTPVVNQDMNNPINGLRYTADGSYLIIGNYESSGRTTHAGLTVFKVNPKNCSLGNSHQFVQGTLSRMLLFGDYITLTGLTNGNLSGVKLLKLGCCAK